MLEIIGIILVTGKVSEHVQSKGWSKWIAAIVPVFWFGGEFTGACLAACFAMENQLATYAGALAGGLIGGLTAGAIAWMLPDRTGQPLGATNSDNIRENPFA